MSFAVDWDIDKYREDHESSEHWQLRRSFMEKWKKNYPEERLVSLAKVFTNVEILGCRYPPEVMQEISKLSDEVAKPYRKLKKTMLQRTFVSASEAAEDRAKGVKRQGGVIIADEPKKKIQFIAAGSSDKINTEDTIKQQNTNNINNDRFEDSSIDNTKSFSNVLNNKSADSYNYMQDLMKLKCLSMKDFRQHMFDTSFGNLVLLIRPWASKLSNIQASCQVCNITCNSVFANNCLTMYINGQIIAEASGESKVEARSVVENMAWKKLQHLVISILVKEQFIAQNDIRISVNDVSGKRHTENEFGTPVENTVAMKMMKMMGWKGGGLGAESQGIAEPIKPNLQLVNRAGLGSSASDSSQLKKAAFRLMERYIASDTIDVDLVFSSDFSKEERALLHMCAQRVGLASRSYGSDKDRFLVVKKKLDPFSLVCAVIEKGGVTPKYQVFIPAELASRKMDFSSLANKNL